MASTPCQIKLVSHQKGLRSLYQLIIERFVDFNELFHDCQYCWGVGNKHIADLQQLDDNWKDENEMQKSNEMIFDYRLFGFRKAGTENYSAQVRLRFEINTYWYGLSVTGDNTNQPFLKKLYHQGLSDEDKRNIVEYLTNKMLDQIEWIVGLIEQKV